MTGQKIDKDQLIKMAVRSLSDEMNFNNEQSNRAINILTSTFSDVDFTATEYMLSVDKCQNEIIVKNFVGCKKMSGIKDNSIEQYVLSVSTMSRFINKNFIDIDTNDIRRFILHYEQSVSKVTANNCRRNLNVFFQFMEDEGYIIKEYLKLKKKRDLSDFILILKLNQ